MQWFIEQRGENRLELSRICQAYQVKLDLIYQDEVVRHSMECNGNISVSMYTSINNPVIWKVSDGFCVKVKGLNMRVYCAGGKIQKHTVLSKEVIDKLKIAKKSTYLY